MLGITFKNVVFHMVLVGVVFSEMYWLVVSSFAYWFLCLHMSCIQHYEVAHMCLDGLAVVDVMLLEQLSW